MPPPADEGEEYEPEFSDEEESINIRGTPVAQGAVSRATEDYGSSFATPRPPLPDSDAERRKSHLLSALRLTAVRSAARARIKQGTPYPRRTSFGAANESVASSTYSPSDATSDDLTTHPRANNSLPLGNDQETRFNGAKLNSYLHTLNTHLTSENQKLLHSLSESNNQVQQLRRELGLPDEHPFSGESGEADSEPGVDKLGRSSDQLGRIQARLASEIANNDSEALREVERLRRLVEDRDGELALMRERLIQAQSPSSAKRGAGLVEQLQREVFDLKDQLSSLAEDSATLRRDLAQAGDWQGRADELLLALEARDAELAEARDAIQEQEAGFAEKMAKLEEELCGVMEDQERQLADARQALSGRADDETGRVSEAMRNERDDLRQQMGNVNNRLTRMTKDYESAMAGRTDALKRIATLEASLAVKVVELEAANAAGLPEQPSSGRRRGSSSPSSIEDELRRVKGALHERVGQIALLEEAAASLRQELRDRQATVGRLEQQVSRLSSDNRSIRDLEEQLLTARRENARLVSQNSMANPSPENHRRDLKAAKEELESQVTALKRQALAAIRSPGLQTPNASVAYESLLAVPTPKTPGQFARDVCRLLLVNRHILNVASYLQISSFIDSPEANSTISPLLAHIHKLEMQIQRLQDQLDSANAKIDDKIDALNSNGHHGSTSLAERLADARLHISKLEADIEAILGADGSFSALKRRLATCHCPHCRHTFDVNNQIKLQIDADARLLTFE